MGQEAFFGLSLVTLIFIIIAGIYKVDEGYVGIVYHQGQLQKQTYPPGFHFTLPLLTHIEYVQVNIQTDQVKNIPCGTSGGVMIYFDSVEVVNKLNTNAVYNTLRQYGVNYDQIWIHDKIHHEINQFCSKNSLEDIYIHKFEQLDEEISSILTEQLNVWVPGLQIISIRITKPTVPKQIGKNFEVQEELRAKIQHVKQQKKVRIQEQETILKQKLIQAQSELDVKTIEMQQLIEQAENDLQMTRIQNQMYLNSQKQMVDGIFYTQEKELEIFEKKFSHEYLQSIMQDALTSNVQLYLGEQIPQFIQTNQDNSNIIRQQQQQQQQTNKNNNKNSEQYQENIHNL